MKVLVVFIPLLAFCAGSSLPKIPEISDYVEGITRYIYIPDGDGKPHLVDLLAKIPESASESKSGADNKYLLFTRQNPTSGQSLVTEDLNSIRNSNYVASRPLVAIVHGWNSNDNSSVNTLIRDAFLDVQDANVIVVDWSSHANGLYTSSVRAVPSVGRYLGDFLNWLIGSAGGNWNNVHLVGFSLGAHAVGNAGRQTSERPARVTGLDPAGPQWGGNSLALNTQSGQYVETINTDGGQLGIYDPIGHANFYPNGGRNSQPGCSKVPLLSSTCSHSRAYQLFASTVRNNHLEGQQCSDISQVKKNQCNGSSLHMGNGIITKRGAGLYRLSTSGEYPY